MTQDLRRIKREEALRLIQDSLPLISYLNENNISYCLVGGLAVLIHSYAAGLSVFRSTLDIDVMVDPAYSNADFAAAYLAVYATNPSFGQAVYDAVFGSGEFELLCESDQAFINCSFIGARKHLDGVDTPDIDLVRMLNGLELKDLAIEAVTIDNVSINVASIDQLIYMKSSTLGYMQQNPIDTPRQKDYIDLVRLRELRGER